MARIGNPLPVQSLRHIAMIIARQRNSVFQIPGTDSTVRPPGKNWSQGLRKRHKELKAKRTKAIDWNRYDHNIYDKVAAWFTAIGEELRRPDIFPENVYNMDETGVMLSVLKSMKVLVGREELRNYRGVGVQRTLITAIECISADGRYLDPLVIWPAATHRSNWTAHPTPGWHFACSKSGYTDSVISLYWLQHVFDPLTKARANGKPRILISDGFGTHESLEALTFCFENNIILCRLPSHTSHKLQPCDIGVFGLLKAAYRQQVEQLYRGGANTIGKQHFTLLYSRAREVAFTQRNIRSAWSKAGLFPFHPERVLGGIAKPVMLQPIPDSQLSSQQDPPGAHQPLLTPTTSESFDAIRKKFECSLEGLNEESKLQFQKIANAAEKAFADRAILFDENSTLFKQNNEKCIRESSKRNVVGNAKIMSEKDIVEAKKKRDEKEVKRGRAHERRKSKAPKVMQVNVGWLRRKEKEDAEREIAAMELSSYCAVFDPRGLEEDGSCSIAYISSSINTA